MGYFVDLKYDPLHNYIPRLPRNRVRLDGVGN